MSLFRKALGLTGWTSLGTVASFAIYTRKSAVYDLEPTDYLLGTTILARFNPHNNKAMVQDVCVRRVPLGSIKEELLRGGEEGRLIERYCGGVFGGWGYAPQRIHLTRKYKGAGTADHLWTSEQLKQSSYNPGTLATDHFEVMNKTSSSIIMRAGDSPRNQGLRADDGLFELAVDVKKSEGVVEFSMKSIFYNGLPVKKGEEKKPPAFVGQFIKWAHEKYDKILIEDGVRNCMR